MRLLYAQSPNIAKVVVQVQFDVRLPTAEVFVMTGDDPIAEEPIGPSEGKAQETRRALTRAADAAIDEGLRRMVKRLGPAARWPWLGKAMLAAAMNAEAEDMAKHVLGPGAWEVSVRVGDDDVSGLRGVRLQAAIVGVAQIRWAISVHTNVPFDEPAWVADTYG